MSYTSILWDSEDDPDGNVQHIAEHGLEIDDVVYQEIDEDTIRVVTAHEVPEGHG